MNSKFLTENMLPKQTTLHNIYRDLPKGDEYADLMLNETVIVYDSAFHKVPCHMNGQVNHHN
jgi:hypothetical protein